MKAHLFEKDNDHTRWSTQAKQIVKLIREHCQPYLEGGQKELFKRSKSSKRFFKEQNTGCKSIPHEDFLNELYITAGHPEVQRPNVTIARSDYKTDLSSGNIVVMFPRNEFSALWNWEITDSTELFQNPNPKLLDVDINKITEVAKSAILEKKEKEFKELIEGVYADHIEAHIDDRLYDAVDIDEEELEIVRKNLRKKWNEHYRPEVAEKIADKMKEFELSSEFKSLVDDMIKEMQDHPEFQIPNYEKFLKELGPKFESDLTLMSDGDYEVLVACEDYYLLDYNFYNVYVKDLLWR